MPKWEFCRVYSTPYYRCWRYWPHAQFAVTGMRGIEQRGAVVDDFGDLVFVPEDVL